MLQKNTFKIGLISISWLTIVACSNDCVTCLNGPSVIEICDTDEINYTDTNGNIITYEEAVALQEQLGFIYE